MKTVLRTRVPCNGCTACCENDLLFLHPELGDDPEAYETMPAVNPMTGQPGHALKHKPGGGCAYLGDNGCTIHDRAPAICREFDCRKMFLALDRDRDHAFTINIPDPLATHLGDRVHAPVGIELGLDAPLAWHVLVKAVRAWRRGNGERGDGAGREPRRPVISRGQQGMSPSAPANKRKR